MFHYNNRYFIWRPIYIFYHISLNSSQNQKCFRQMLYRKSKHTFCVQQHFFFESRAVHEVMWKNIAERGRPLMTIRCTRTANATDTHSECVILTAFAPQQWLCERAPVLHYTYTACLKFSVIIRKNPQHPGGLCPSRELAQWKRNTSVRFCNQNCLL
jgi:hypothetical protein